MGKATRDKKNTHKQSAKHFFSFIFTCSFVCLLVCELALPFVVVVLCVVDVGSLLFRFGCTVVPVSHDAYATREPHQAVAVCTPVNPFRLIACSFSFARPLHFTSPTSIVSTVYVGGACILPLFPR